MEQLDEKVMNVRSNAGREVEYRKEAAKLK